MFCLLLLDIYQRQKTLLTLHTLRLNGVQSKKINKIIKSSEVKKVTANENHKENIHYLTIFPHFSIRSTQIIIII